MNRVSLVGAHETMKYAYPTSHGPPTDVARHQAYVLHEMDWVELGEYMDRAHIPSLYSLCPSSYVSPSCLELKVPWALLLHHLDLDVQRIVMNMIIEGK